MTNIQRTAAVLSALALFLSPVTANADWFDDQINQLNGEVSRNQTKINELKARANTLSNQVALLNAQINAAEAELEITQKKYDKTAADLEHGKAELARKKLILAQNLRTLYKESETTLIEKLSSSDNFDEFIRREDHLQELRDSVYASVEKIKELNARLEKDKADLANLIEQEKAQKEALTKQRTELSALLAETQGEEALYQQKVKNDSQRISQLRAAQAALIARNSRTISSGGCGGYPAVWCSAPQDSLVDDWGFYNRECTSYAAWYRSAIGRPIPAWGYMGYADAKTWDDWARRSGYRVDKTPEIGAIGVFKGGTYGHVMIVQGISGSQVLVSQFNEDMTGHYSTSYWPISSLVFIH